MVLVTNEWPNKSEDEQKSPTSSSATTANVNASVAAGTIGTKPTTTTTTSNNTAVTAANATTAPTAHKANVTAASEAATTSSNPQGTLKAQALDGTELGAPTASGITLVGATTSSTATKANTEQIKEVDKLRVLQKAEPDAAEVEEDTISNSSTISDLDESSITLNEHDNNNSSINTTRASSNNSPSASDAAIENNDLEYLSEAACNDLDVDHEQDQEDDDERDEQDQAYYNRISSNELSSALYSAFKSIKPIDNYSNNKRTSTATSATPTNTAINATSASAPATATNTISSTYLSTFGMGMNANNMQQQQQQQQQPLKSGYTAITTNILDAQQQSNNNNNTNNNNNNNNVNTMNNNNNSINSNLAANAGGISTTTLSDDNKTEAKIVLLCEPKSHPFKTRTIPLTPKIECKVGRLIARSKALETNAIFDCKVLSRNHAVLWYTEDGKFWVKDTKSSNGTFINDRKLDNDAAELHFGDVVKFGVDVWENSRKEAHGCIIALVRLYLPDGREAIDPDTQRTQFSGEGRISYDEIHRLNMFMQEAAAREKGLKTKLCSIQNVLDITRKNSALCWQSMVNEDQLLHRINSLEKKLQIMDKNVPESVLRNEVLKLLDDKNSYQITAKEALRKVYQERCDALQMLAKVEADYAQAENECSLLREGIAVTKQSMQEINERLMQLENEYHEYKEEIQRQQLEAKAKEEEHVHVLREQLEQREIECENLQRQIVQLQKAASAVNISKTKTKNAGDTADAECGKPKNRKKSKSSGSSGKDDDTVGTTDTDDEEKEVIGKLDAAIESFLNIDDDDDDDDDVEDEANDSDENDNDDDDNDEDSEDKTKSDKRRTNDNKRAHDSSDKQIKPDELNVLGELEKVFQTSEIYNGKHDVNNKMGSLKRKKQKSDKAEKDLKQKVVKKSTIMKWLKKSDLNKNEGSLDIFKAMFNNEDAEDSNGEPDADDDSKYDIAGAGANKQEQNLSNDNAQRDDEYERKCNNFRSKLQNVQNNLEQLEAEIVNETNKEFSDVASDIIAKDVDDDSDDTDEDDDDDDDEEAADNEFIIRRNGATAANAAAAKKTVTSSKQNRSSLLLKQSIDMLREAFTEISIMQPQQQQLVKRETGTGIDKETQYHKQNERLQTQETLKPTTNAKVNEHDTDDDEPSSVGTEDVFLDNENDDSSSVGSEHLSIASDDSSTQQTVQAKQTKKSSAEHDAQRRYEEQIKLLEMQINDMRKQMQNTENDAQHTLEIMQIECDTYKLKLNDLALVIDTLREEKQELEAAMKENATKPSECNDGAAVDDATSSQQQKNKSLQRKHMESDVCSSDGTLNLSIDSCKSDAMFEKELHEERDAALALEREEELVAFKERLEQQHQINHNLLMEIDEWKQKALSQTHYALLRQVLPIGAIAIAALVYFATQNIFK